MRSNFHTHSIYCDGRDTPREMAETACALDFFALGFSGHREPAFSDCGMTPEREAAYRAEITGLKEEYAGRMEIYCGIEQDILAGKRDPWYDYAIGSVHYIEKDGRHLCVDWSAEKTAQHIARHYHGDAIAYAADYYAQVARVKEATGCDIIGHFDLLTKFDEGESLFSGNDPRYRRAVMPALEALCAPGTVFEINTGAMARGYRAMPYPALWILRELKERSCAVMINSDCHDRQKLAFGADTAVALAREAGFASQVILQKGQFAEIAL
ncbi:MAG: histidinol-phosphatase HisJ family protein [Clostridia bacterium]|nr:histidinol-phosphatase HisJ family protein [Clostridia bacterium]